MILTSHKEIFFSRVRQGGIVVPMTKMPHFVQFCSSNECCLQIAANLVAAVLLPDFSCFFVRNVYHFAPHMSSTRHNS
jgi:hypothetical protein